MCLRKAPLIDEAYNVLSDGNNVSIGNMMHPPLHPIYEMREQEWNDIHLIYWKYHIPSNVPTSEHIQFLIQQIMTAGAEVTFSHSSQECIRHHGRRRRTTNDE